MMEQKRVVIRVWCLIDQRNMSRCEGEIEKAGVKVKEVTRSRQQVKEEEGREALENRKRCEADDGTNLGKPPRCTSSSSLLLLLLLSTLGLSISLSGN